MDLIQGALKDTDKWCKEKALSTQGDKSAAIIFTRRYKIKTLRNMVVVNSEIQ